MRAMRYLAFAFASLSLLAPSLAHAQSDEPVPPGGGPISGDDATPAPASKKPREKKAAPVDDPTVGVNSLSAHVRYLFVTKAMLSPYLKANTGTAMNGAGIGLEYAHRYESFDLVATVDMSFFDVQNGNYLASGHDASLDTHFVTFQNLGLLSADISIIGYHKFLPWLELRYGGGLGVGWVPGTVSEVNDGPQCTNANAHDPSKCYPVTTGPLSSNQKGLFGTLEKTGHGTDTADSPHYHAVNSKPPAMAVLNALVGVRFYPVQHMQVTAEIGFRDSMFVGLSGGYLF